MATVSLSAGETLTGVTGPGSLKDITRDTPFVEKLPYVLMEMADCEVVPDNLDNEVLEAMFKAGS